MDKLELQSVTTIYLRLRVPERLHQMLFPSSMRLSGGREKSWHYGGEH